MSGAAKFVETSVLLLWSIGSVFQSQAFPLHNGVTVALSVHELLKSIAASLDESLITNKGMKPFDYFWRPQPSPTQPRRFLLLFRA